MNKLLNKFLRDESGDVTIEFVIIIAAAVVLSIAAMVVFAPGLGTATGYSMTLLDFDREGVENPGCRYIVNEDGSNSQYLMAGQENNTSNATASISCEDVDDYINENGAQAVGNSD